MRTVSANIDYNELTKQLYDTCIFTDAWIDGKPRFTDSVVVLTRSELAALYRAAERLGKLFDEGVDIVERNSELSDSYFGLTSRQKLMFEESGGNWHGIARFDLFFTTDGRIQTCEINADTPSGEPETVVLNKLFETKLPGLTNPNSEFESAFVRTALKHYELSTAKRAGKDFSVGLVYPTELPEDLSMIRLYTRWFNARGIETVPGSPFNLDYDPKANVLTLSGKKVDLIIRHYKTDWWGERISAWNNYEFPDAEPLDKYLLTLFSAEAHRSADVFNPFGSVLVQNKLMTAFFYDYKHLFSPESQSTIDDYVPVTRRAVDFVPSDKSAYVLKSDYGCEGDEVIIGINTSEDIWQKTLGMIRPEHWIFQERFETLKPGGIEHNFGVYILAGRAAGIFTRLSEKSTDYYSVCAPTFIEND